MVFNLIMHVVNQHELNTEPDGLFFRCVEYAVDVTLEEWVREFNFERCQCHVEDV